MGLLYARETLLEIFIRRQMRSLIRLASTRLFPLEKCIIQSAKVFFHRRSATTGNENTRIAQNAAHVIAHLAARFLFLYIHCLCVCVGMGIFVCESVGSRTDHSLWHKRPWHT